MTTTTDWKKVLEDNRDAIEAKMFELRREWEGNNPDVHEGLAIEPSGKLYTWIYVGNFSAPESVWNGTDFHITTFHAWNWDDEGVDWEEVGPFFARNDAEKECIIRRIKETREEHEPISEMIREEFPEVYADIAESIIDAEMEHYWETESDLLDDIIANID